MTAYFYLLLPVFFLAALGLVGCFRRYALSKGLLDSPNARSSHQSPTPRGGGVVFVGLWLGAALLVWGRGEISSEAAFFLLPGAFLVAGIGYGDDLYDVSPLWRIVTHFIAALIAVYFLLAMDIRQYGWEIFFWPELGVVAGILFAMVWSINLFNFMDGIDGLAGMEACFVFSVGGWWLWEAEAYGYAYLAWVLVAVVAGFLVWNWPSARIFMGDGGSGFLGFLIAAFTFAGHVWWDIPILLWIIVYGVFWFDATVTLLRRILAGERWYSAHCSHAYQRLYQIGWSHRKVLLAISGINMALVTVALWADANREALPWIFLVTLMFLGIIYGGIERLRPMYPKE
ncbi:MraY family glycosyltransferase [Nitrosococcus oceani]|uniref:MraY family glycosyltransferase n=1 Tax=Nitrosococcus oceani TaxID=1229 RepID=UPI00030DEDB5|nr:glycosyltransferase family 4 protein [Nitrosococcus oceani]GEM18975.1 glycosyl transferase [Nitrosococcus oceani]